MGLTASAVGERIALVWSLSQLLRELDINSLECPPHMSDVLPMQMQVRSIYCHRRRCNSAYRRAAAVSRTHRRVGRRWLPCTRDLRTYCHNADASPLHSLPPTQVRGSCPPHVSSLQLQVGRRQGQRDRRSAA